MLQEMARRTAECLRESDISGRWGGEEFVVLLPMTNASDAMSLANRLGERISSTPIQTCGGTLSITASFGVAQFTPGESFEQLVARADSGLYEAKHQGRNRSVLQE